MNNVDKTLYSYDAGIVPLDWEFCFLDIDEYKKIVTEKYYLNKIFFESVVDGGIEFVIKKIDDLLEQALNEHHRIFRKTCKLRCKPMIFPLPTASTLGDATFCIILKNDDDGDTGVYSPIPLSYLE